MSKKNQDAIQLGMQEDEIEDGDDTGGGGFLDYDPLNNEAYGGNWIEGGGDIKAKLELIEKELEEIELDNDGGDVEYQALIIPLTVEHQKPKVSLKKNVKQALKKMIL